MLRREFRQKVGGRLPDALAQAAGRRLELPGLHLRGDRPGLGEGGFAGLHGEYRLQGRGRPIPVVGRHLREHVAHEVHHAPLVLRPGKHRVHRGDESRAPVADHEAHALQTAFDHASYELLPAGSVLPHALRHADDLAVALRVDADGDEDADVLHASAPGALVPHAVHEHVRVFGFQWPGAPSVDVVIHALELVGKGLGWHPVTPQQFADVVDLTGAHSRQVHLHQRLLDAGLPPAVAFDDRGFEDRALEFRHPELEPARLCRERAFVVAGPVRLAPLLAFVSGGPGDLVGLGVEHGVEDLGHLLGDQPVEFGFEQVLVDLYDVAVGHGCASCFPIAILCLATENRTQDAGHARFNISTKNKTESAQEFGRYLDHAPGLVGIRYDLEQEPGALLVDRHVAELVDDQEPRLGDLPELRVEPVLALRAAQPHEQPGRGEEPDRYRAHVREPAQRDREMRLAGADGLVEHEWIGNSVLDGFLEDESLFGEFLRAPVSEGGVEPLVVGPPHVVVEVMPQLLDRGVVVPVHELLLQRPVRRFDHGVVVGVALV